MKDKFNALWKSKNTSCFISNVFAKQDIPPYARLCVMKNQFHKNGDYKPPYVFFFVKGDAEYCESLMSYEEPNEEYLYTFDEVQSIIHQVEDDIRCGYTDRIVTDYIEDRRQK